MLFALLFLILTASGAYFFPDWPLGMVALGAFAGVAALRLLLLPWPKRQADKDR